MDDEINSADDLIERAWLREVVTLCASASRASAGPVAAATPPEELRAPESEDDFAAIELRTRLTDTELVVRMEVKTCNAYAGFQVDIEAVFALPAPIALGKEAMVHEFAGTVGAASVFPYARNAVASLAAQLAVPASPLPLLPAGGIELLHEDEPSGSAVPDGVLVAGTFARTNEDGTTEQLGEFFVDAETGNLVRYGAEGEDPDIEELLEIMSEAAAGGPWVQIASADEETWQGLIREHGLDEAHALAESIRPTEGDEAADGVLARIETAAWNIRLEEAIRALNDAMSTLDEAVSANTASGTETDFPGSVPTKLLDAAVDVIARWAVYRDL
jgi:hypothetical protein